MRNFNIALLGKQAWRLITCPNKLVSRVFKARYYPNGSFLSAKLGSNPSYIWRSVLESKNLVTQGIACRVGSGQEIEILNTPWLPTSSDPYVHTLSESLQNEKVSSLMRSDERCWDEDLIWDVFEVRDAEIILSIPLHQDEKDSWYWSHEKMGHYSVKSAYVRLQELRGTSNTLDSSGFWRKLWQLKIPSKVKNFLWRAVTNCLPTKDLLRVRSVQVNALCSTCNLLDESVLHALVSCSFADACYQLTEFISPQGTFSSFSEWLQQLFSQKVKSEIEALVMVCWLIWKNRNDIVWKQHSSEPQELVRLALSILNQWRSVQDRSYDSFLSFMSSEDGQEQWHLPELNSVKINIDAALFEDPGRYSYAIVVRNHEGRLVQDTSKCSLGRVAPEFAEALGIREALSWVKTNQYSNAVLESDCLQVVQLIRSSFAITHI